MHDKAEILLSQAFGDICEGFCGASLEEGPVYIKHFGFRDQRILDAFYNTLFSKAQERGLPTEQESLDFLREEGLWGERDEKEINTQKLYIENLGKTKANLLLRAQRDQIEKDLIRERAKLLKLQEQRSSLLKNTCESYAQNKLNNKLLHLSLYRDAELQELYFDQRAFDELSPVEIVALTVIYNEATEHISGAVIKKIAVSSFFINYFNIVSEAAHEFFPGNILDWTFFQVNLVNYGRIFKNIFDNVSDIPDRIRGDPEALLEFAQSDTKRRKTIEKSQAADSYSLVGAEKQDLEDLGVDGGEQLSLSDFAKKRGGKLDVSDFADMFGK